MTAEEMNIRQDQEQLLQKSMKSMLLLAIFKKKIIDKEQP